MRIDWKSFTKHRTRDNKNAFPIGSAVFVGYQGQGKTLSMVDYAFRIRKDFPECLIYSNIKLYGLDYNFVFSDEDVKEALSVQNGAKGVLVLLDEAHLYFGKKTGIGLEVLTAISQQRKDRRRIVFSSQIWEELDISLRKQVKDIFRCRKVLNMIVLNRMDGESLSYDKLKGEYVAKHLGFEVYKLNDEYYSRYSTYQKIITNDELVAPLATRAPAQSAPSDATKTNLIPKKGLFA